jgi:hypothetical protein
VVDAIQSAGLRSGGDARRVAGLRAPRRHLLLWYLAIPLAGFALVGAVGFPRIAKGAALYVSVALLAVGVWSIAGFLYVGRAQQESSILVTAAELLPAEAQPGDKAMLEPIGMIGYIAPVVVVDEIGLVSPQVTRLRRQGAGWYADVVTRERPEWLVVRESTYRSGAAFAGKGDPFRNAAERDAVFARYRRVAGGDSGSGDQALVVLRRID